MVDDEIARHDCRDVRRRVAADGDRPALHFKQRRQVRRPHLERDWPTKRAALAAALVKLGVKPGDRVIQVSENRYEWIVLDLADPHGPRHSRGRALARSPARRSPIRSSTAARSWSIVSGPEQAQKLAAAAEQLAGRRAIPFVSIRCTATIGGQSDPPLVRTGRAVHRSGRPQVASSRPSPKPSPTTWPRFCTPRARPASPRA